MNSNHPNLITNLQEITNKESSIVSLLSYFDIFNHPLTPEDLARLTGTNVEITGQILNKLTKAKVCYEWKGYYGISNEVEVNALKRKQAEQEAIKYWKKVKKYANVIANFPFVKGVAISGSLSKGVMTADGDIDFFIITEPGKLWLTRSLLILYKKVRLLNSRKYFCLNYFVDTNNLIIIDKNIFTAVEVAHLIPVYSQGELFQEFYNKNSWVAEFVTSPASIIENAQPSDAFYGLKDYVVIKKSKKRKEKWLGGTIGKKLERWTHKKTLKRWMKKFGHFSEEKFELTMRSTEGVSKHHPQDFQSKVLDTHAQKFTKSMEILKNQEHAQ